MLQELMIDRRIREGNVTVCRERRGKADACAEPIPVVLAASRPQLMAARPHWWLERLTAEVLDANRSPVGAGSEVRGCFGTEMCGKCWKR